MRSVGYALAMVIAAIGGACAQTVPQYDLTCTGSVSSSAINPDGTVTPPSAAPSPYTTKLHIDLTSKSFCEDDCKASQPLYSVGADAIIFNLAKGNAGERFWMARDLGTFFKVWTEIGDVKKNEHDLLKSASGQCVLVSPNAVPTSVKHDVSHPASPPLDHSTHAEPQANLQTSSELASEDIMALVNVSNHRPVEQQQIARLHALGYVGWSDDILTLTEKGRNLVGGQ